MNNIMVLTKKEIAEKLKALHESKDDPQIVPWLDNGSLVRWVEDSNLDGDRQIIFKRGIR